MPQQDSRYDSPAHTPELTPRPTRDHTHEHLPDHMQSHMQTHSQAQTHTPARSPERQRFYDAIDRESLAPLWEVLGDLVPRTPRTPVVPVHWRYAGLRDRLLEAGRLITASEAERRVLVLENPGLRGKSSITHSLYAGMQLLLPGEIAPSHRHTATAIRLIVEGRGAFTSVDGERTPMEPGDFIITPSWTFHDHGNPGDEPVIWLDGLDVPIVQFLDAAFSDKLDSPDQRLTKADDDSLARYGANMVPADRLALPARNPVFRYPYASTRPALERLAANGPVHPAHGVKMRFSNPLTGGYPTTTMAAFMQWLPDGFDGSASRSTDGTACCVVEGHGVSFVGEQRIDWGPHDVFVVPPWLPVRHCVQGGDNAVVFSMSDRPVQQALGIWREQAD